MKNIISIALFLSIAITMVCCVKQSQKNIDSAIINVDGCELIEHQNTDYTVCLDSVWDSRCPNGVECIWTGFATCRFKVAVNNQSYILKLSTLNINPYYATDTTINGIKFQLKDLTPYPSVSSPYPYKDYKATIIISN